MNLIFCARVFLGCDPLSVGTLKHEQALDIPGYKIPDSELPCFQTSPSPNREIMANEIRTASLCGAYERF